MPVPRLHAVAGGLSVAASIALASCAPALNPGSPGADTSALRQVASPGKLTPGTGSFTFTNWAGSPLKVFYYVPDEVTANTRVLVVMHGMSRNAEGYRNDWVPFARQGKFIVVTPEFSNADFPTAKTYNLGNIADDSGMPRPREQWSFSAIEPLFEHVRRATGSRVPTYALYGHSAGGQFLHRFLTFVPEARFSHMVVANSGWYTLPDLSVDFPYGLRGTSANRSRLAAALGKKVTVLLGTADIDPNHHQLSKTPEAMAQGPHRLARGEYFFGQAKAAAAALKTPFAWKIAYAPDIAHSNKGMSAAAAPLIWD